MFQDPNEAELLEQIRYPAFLVCNGKVTAVNHGAWQRQITESTDVASLIQSGQQEYSEFTQGRLCLTLSVDDITYGASVTKLNSMDLFCLDPDSADAELRVLSVAAQYLRDPLSSAVISAEALRDSASDDSLRSLNHHLHRLHRAICNMSDAATYSSKQLTKAENCNISAEIAESVEKAKTLLESINCKLLYEQRCGDIYCQVDKEKLQRAVLNLISNAVRYGQKGSSIELLLSRKNNLFCVSVTSRLDPQMDVSGSRIFAYYKREPALCDAQNGIGIGMTIARNAAAAHGGTLLFDQPDSDSVRFTITVPIPNETNLSLRSPIVFPIDYCGGFDHLLTELSDILPDEVFE